jgi:hypothetical protein
MAFLLTQIVEVPLYRWLAPVTWPKSFSLSAVTHPAVWYVIPPLCYGWGLSYHAMIWIAELFAWSVEAAMLRGYGVRWRRALVVSLCANGASVLVGMATRSWFGWP